MHCARVRTRTCSGPCARGAAGAALATMESEGHAADDVLLALEGVEV